MPKGYKFRSWYIDYFNFYKEMGLIKKKLVPEEHINKLVASIDRNEPEHWIAKWWLKQPDAFLEQYILKEYGGKLISVDPKSISEDEEFYKNLLNRLNDFSDSKFRITDIKETCFEDDGEDAFIKLEFKIKDIPKHIWLHKNRKYAYPEFIYAINHILELNNQCFEISGTPNEWLISFIENNVKEQLNERNWNFWIEYSDVFEPQFLLWQAKQNIKTSDYKEVLYWLDESTIQETIIDEPWLMFYRGLANLKLGKQNKAWSDWSYAIKSQDEEVLAEIEKFK